MLDSKAIASELSTLLDIASTNPEIDPRRREDLVAFFHAMINANQAGEVALLDSITAGFGKWTLMDMDFEETPFGGRCVQLINQILTANEHKQ